MSELISIIVPVYHAESFLDELYQRIDKTFKAHEGLEFELLLVNDASPDDSWEIIARLCRSDQRVKGINFSRNFGQHYAITAGLTHGRGDWMVVMDCDLQDQPEEIPRLYDKAREGYDSVFASRYNRKDNFLTRVRSRIFYMLFNYLTGIKIDASIANFGIYNHKVIKAILSMNDVIRYFPLMSNWVGFSKTILPVEHAERKSGKSSYSMVKLIKLASENIIAFSEKPLKLCLIFGLFIVILALVVFVIYFILAVTGHILVAGYASLILSIWFLGGVQIAIVGLVGIYIGKIFNQVKDRPCYIIREELNFDRK